MPITIVSYWIGIYRLNENRPENAVSLLICPRIDDQGSENIIFTQCGKFDKITFSDHWVFCERVHAKHWYPTSSILPPSKFKSLIYEISRAIDALVNIKS